MMTKDHMPSSGTRSGSAHELGARSQPLMLIEAGKL
jgi:hypothetical protein